jgi:predicted Zn-dependent protease
VVVLCVMLSIFACATTSNVGTIDDSLRSDYVPLEEERWAKEQADKFHADFVERGLIYREAGIRAYLEQMEHRVLREKSDLQGHIRLYIVKAPVPNAFAMPNGNIYVHSGLFTTLETEDQLAAIVSHEIAHVTRRHALKAIISQKNTLIGAHIGDFATGGLGLVYFGAFAHIMRFSRAQESEADEVGLSLLADAGYQPAAMTEAFESLGKDPELKHVKNSIYSSHPSFQSRIVELDEMARAMRGISPAMETWSEDFVVLKATMMEDSMKIRLRNRQFNLAKSIADSASDYFSDQTAVNFYYGEVYRGFSRFPDDAAREEYWIETGKWKIDKDTQAKYLQQKEANLVRAVDYYRQAASADPPHTKSLRRLAEVAEEEGDYQGAVHYFSLYLESAPAANDRLYVERALERLDQPRGSR